MEHAGQNTETAEGDIDEGVGAAETALYPDCRWSASRRQNKLPEAGFRHTRKRREEQGEDAQEYIGAAHGCLVLNDV